MRQLDEATFWKIIIFSAVGIFLIIVCVRMYRSVCSQPIMNVCPQNTDFRAKDHWERRRDAQLEIAKDATHHGLKKRWEDVC